MRNKAVLTIALHPLIIFLAVMLGACTSFEAKSNQVGQLGHAESNALALGETFAHGFYTQDPATALSVLHPALSKLGVIPNIRNSGRSALLRLTPGTLEAFAAAHNADGHIDPETAVTQIDFLDIAADAAVFRLIADRDWFDYYLAARVGDQWYLLNGVFGGYSQIENPALQDDRTAIIAAMRAYSEAFAVGDFQQLKRSVYLDFERRSVITQGGKSWVAPETLETIEHQLSGIDAGLTPQLSFLGATQITGAVRVDAPDRTEWVFLLKMDGAWRPVNSFWIATGK